MVRDPFDQAFSSLVSLTSEATYRLATLTPPSMTWDEEPLTAVLLAQLTCTRRFRIDASCPHDDHHDRHDAANCGHWRGTRATTVTGGLRPVTKPEEGGANDPLGADILLNLGFRHGSGIRLLIQAKRLKLTGKGSRLASLNLEKLTARSNGSQLDVLTGDVDQS